MATSVAKGVDLSLSLLSTTVRLTGAKDKPETLRTLCAGIDGKQHDPAPIHMDTICDTCGTIDYSHKKELLKGRPVGDGFQIVTQDEVQALAAEHEEQFKKKINLTPHPADQVEFSTQPGEKVYYLLPDGATGRYAEIAALIERHPELAFCALYTARSRSSFYVLKVRNGQMVLQERTRTAEMRETPDLGLTANEQMVDLADELIAGMVTDYNPDEYRSTYAEALNSALDARGLTTVAPTTTTVATAGDDDLERLRAAVAAMKGAA